jgi:hypothetical protein
VLFVFGNPPYFRASTDWEQLFSVLDTAPILITEDEPVRPISAGSYPWPPMSRAQDGELTQNSLRDYLVSFYNKAQAWDYRVASAFPGFHDIYKDAGVGPGYGYLDARQGEMLRFTLQAALKSDPEVIQLVTWNDYGEGTNIEPTAEYGYQYLEIVQDARRSAGNVAFPFTSEDLTIPLQIYELRKRYTGDADVNARLDRAVNAVIAGQLDAAQALLSK